MPDIRKLTREDIPEYKSIRLLGLEEAPYAFGSSVEEEQEQDEDFFYQGISNIFMMGAYYESKLVSTAGLFLEKGMKRRHKGGIWGVYTKEEYRGQGIGKKIIQSVLDNVPDTVEQVFLDVWDENVPALRLYEGFGFEKTGIEKHAIKWQGQYYDEIKMVKFLKEPFASS